VVTHQQSPRLPNVTLGTTRVEPDEKASKVKLPTAIGPPPGKSSTNCWPPSHPVKACSARLNRSGPVPGSIRAATPKPARAWPGEIQTISGSWSSSGNGPGTSKV